MSNVLKGLSIVRREEENNEANATDKAEALDHQANAELPSNNDAADRRDNTRENAENLAKVGANHGYEK
jgi:hypothetical protein